MARPKNTFFNHTDSALFSVDEGFGLLGDDVSQDEAERSKMQRALNAAQEYVIYTLEAPIEVTRVTDHFDVLGYGDNRLRLSATPVSDTGSTATAEDVEVTYVDAGNQRQKLSDDTFIVDYSGRDASIGLSRAGMTILSGQLSEMVQYPISVSYDGEGRFNREGENGIVEQAVAMIVTALWDLSPEAIEDRSQQFPDVNDLLRPLRRLEV